jgi:hypothetical protein
MLCVLSWSSWACRQRADIIYCMRNGEVVTSTEQIYATLMAYCSGAQHPKLHVSAQAGYHRHAAQSTGTHPQRLLSRTSSTAAPPCIVLM